MKYVIDPGDRIRAKIWAYEAIPSIGKHKAEKLQNDVLRMLCWNAQMIPSANEIQILLNNANLIVHCTVSPTIEEASQLYYRDLVLFPNEENDPKVDLFLEDLEDHIGEDQVVGERE